MVERSRDAHTVYTELRFAESAAVEFQFLREWGMSLASHTPCVVRFESESRYVVVRYECRFVEVSCGASADGDSYSVKELFSATSPRERYRESSGATVESVRAALAIAATQTKRVMPHIVADFAASEVKRYRESLVEYYEGKRERSPDFGKLP